jgi:hypothetical protein
MFSKITPNRTYQLLSRWAGQRSRWRIPAKYAFGIILPREAAPRLLSAVIAFVYGFVSPVLVIFIETWAEHGESGGRGGVSRVPNKMRTHCFPTVVATCRVACMLYLDASKLWRTSKSLNW